MIYAKPLRIFARPFDARPLTGVYGDGEARKCPEGEDEYILRSIIYEVTFKSLNWADYPMASTAVTAEGLRYHVGLGLDGTWFGSHAEGRVLHTFTTGHPTREDARQAVSDAYIDRLTKLVSLGPETSATKEADHD